MYFYVESKYGKENLNLDFLEEQEKIDLWSLLEERINCREKK